MSDFLTNCLKISAAVLLPNIGGYIGGLTVRKNIKPWYESLNKPIWNPPDYVFAPVWTCIYSGIGFASYLVYKEINAGRVDRQSALIAAGLYAGQMILNWAWAPIFFHYHSLKWSAVEATALTVSAATCGYVFYRINRTAGWLFVPYLLWLGYATALNYTIFNLNGNDSEGNQSTDPKQD